MSKESFITRYKEIEATDLLDQSVAGFWNILLSQYFNNGHNIIEYDRRPGRDNSLHMDIVVSSTDGNLCKAVFLVVNNLKRECEAQSAEWATAIEQLTGHLQDIREAQQSYRYRDLYAAISSGTRVQFYQLRPTMQTLEDLPFGHPGKAYELQQDETEIHEILNYLLSTCMQSIKKE